MHPHTASDGRVRAFLVAALALLVGVTLAAATARAQPAVDAGEQPEAGPIVYNLVPGEGEWVFRSDLNRAGATIETRRDVGIRSAEVFVDGREMPRSLMGPTRYLQSVSADAGHLRPGFHTVRVVATDSRGRAGGYTWMFVVLPG